MLEQTKGKGSQDRNRVKIDEESNSAASSWRGCRRPSRSSESGGGARALVHDRDRGHGRSRGRSRGEAENESGASGHGHEGAIASDGAEVIEIAA